MLLHWAAPADHGKKTEPYIAAKLAEQIKSWRAVGKVRLHHTGLHAVSGRSRGSFIFGNDVAAHCVCPIANDTHQHCCRRGEC